MVNYQKKETDASFFFDSDAIRTHDLPLRRRMLYPAELLNHKHIDYITKLK